MNDARGPGATMEPGSFAPVNEERVLMRSDEGRMLTGVCAGLGRYTGMDPVIFRVGFAALVIGSGIGIMLYVAAFLLMRNKNGGPGYVEQWSRRVFDTETVMALLAAIFALGLIINLAADGISTATVVVGTLLAITLLAAHARGVDLPALARSLPERARGRRGTRPAPDNWLGHPFGGAQPYPSQPFPSQPFPSQPYPSQPYPSYSDAAPGAPFTGTPAASAPPAGAAFSGAPAAAPPTTAAPFPDTAAAPFPEATAASARPAAPSAGAPQAGRPSDAARTETLSFDAPADVTRVQAPPADAPAGAPGGQAPPSDAVPSDAVPSDAVPPSAVPPAAAAASAQPAAGLRSETGAAPASGSATESPYRRLADLAEEALAASRRAGRAPSGPGVAAGHGSTPYEPAATPAGSPRYGDGRLTGGGFDSSGEPFAPRGPYRPYDSSRQYEPPAWVYGRPPRTATARRDRPKSFIGGITVFLALMVGGIMVAAQSSSSTLNPPVIGGAMLITIGAGLLIATWFGRGAGLVATGTIVSLLLVAGTTMNGIPKKIGTYTWEPLDSAQAVRTYSVGIGDGTLDLRSTKFVPGSLTRFDASVSVGELKVIVPRTARVKVFGYARLGDVTIEHVVQGGADVHHDKVLEPDVKPSGAVPVIELHVKAGIGDVEVSRAAA
ncbi:PspC domain-containing protein [Sphaerisporangium dianthi]|uniref:PspC domain-containing protein n=1 Tax=Sphaerisporangium dianthi TaxID=1436120 RepID=A0ABV9CP63_9ACTN